MAQVIIGPSFFKKEFNEYEDWHWAWVREILQNSIDARSSTVVVTFEEADGKTIATVENNGRPMTEDILVNKLLALGESGKNFFDEESTVGGFGKAKGILMLCHDSWKVETGSVVADGVGGQYELSAGDYLHGTRTTVVMSGYHQERLERAMRRFCKFAQYRGQISMNGQVLATDLVKGARRREFTFGTVYTNKSDSHVLVVRIGGIPMFTKYVSHDRCVVVELSGRSDERLTSNRDGMISPYRETLDSFVSELAVDKRSALKDRPPRYARFAGDKLSHISVRCDEQTVSVIKLVDAPAAGPDLSGSEPESPDLRAAFIEGVDLDPDAVINGPIGSQVGTQTWQPGGGIGTAASMGSVREVATLGHEFIVKNETDLVVPPYYRPDNEQFSSHSKKLIRLWGRLIIELHRMFDHSASFAVGFIFSDNTEAEFEDGRYGKVYYIGPAKVVEQSSSYSKSFKKRWKLTDRDQILAVATHEFVHGLGFGWHDELFANKLTDLMGKVMAERKRFNWCFK